MHAFRQLANVPVHYDRHPASTGFGYGTTGKAATFYAMKAFISKMEAMFTELFATCPASLGSAKVITTAGAYVNKAGYHGLGRAFDLDGIFWDNRSFVTLNFPGIPEFYLGVESVIRKHFGTVLNYDYDAAHQDHFHFDDGTNVGWNKFSKSRVVYVQNCLFYLHGSLIARDGVYGPETDTELKRTLKANGIGPISTTKNWLQFLSLNAGIGLSK